MFEPLYTADEMRAAEAGHDVDAMMERAGRAVAEAILERYPSARRIACVCGGGANGGDGRIAARILREAGRDAREQLVDDADLVVDALFGTGFHGEPRPYAAALIESMNGAGAPVVAVDVPSGVDASTGEVGGADALHELQPFERDAPTVLTPHEGELARLLGEESEWVAAHRLEALRRGVERFGCVVLLKGADTLVGAPGQDVLVRAANAPGLATAGTGDVLTGIVAAFLAKGLDARLAAAAAATAQAKG